MSLPGRDWRELGANAGGRGRTGWRAAVPELLVAAIALAATACAAFAVADGAAAALVVVAFAAAALAVMTRLLPAGPASPAASGISPKDRWATAGRYLSYWRLEDRLRDGISSQGAYETNLGPYLEHLLAARLSERHNVNLYQDPDAARRLLCAGDKDNDLWPWVDPRRVAAPEPESPGIPVRSLSRLVRRIEQL